MPKLAFYAILGSMFRSLAVTMLLLLTACTVPVTSTPAEPESQLPLATFTPVRAHDAAAPASPVPLSQFWQMLFPGAEIAPADDGLLMLRHAPNLVRFQVQFDEDPQAVQFLSQWLENNPEAMAAVNCGFYWEDDGRYLHMGLLELAGQRRAPVRGHWGAALIIRDGVATIVRQPKFGVPAMDFGLQGWPTLLWRGQVVDGLDAETVARRTAVGVDASGRMLWVVDPAGSTLQAFAQRLRRSDVGLVDAVNLDGGASTGLMWREVAGEPVSGVDSMPIPCVILLSPLE